MMVISASSCKTTPSSLLSTYTPHSRLNVLRIRDRPRLLCLFFITVSRLGRGLLRFRLNVVEPIFVITRVCGVKISCSDCETSQAFNYIISTLICHFIAFILDSLLHSICLLGFIFIVMRLFSFPQEIGWNSPTWVLWISFNIVKTTTIQALVKSTKGRLTRLLPELL